MRCPHCGEDATDRARYCPGCGARLDPAAGAAAPTRRVVTVLFADVTGSTGLAERFDPETMRGLMSRYFDRMRAVLERHGGTVEKFVGDAVMAVFGLPRVHEDDALRAVRAASDMRVALERLNDDLEREHGVRLQARIGVNTGEVVAGEPGAATLVTGDPVNVAARLQQAAQPGEVLVGPQTRSLVRDAARLDELPPMEVRGRSTGLVAYRLVDVDDVGRSMARNLETPLVGRARERDALLGVYARCVEHRACHLVTVLGPAGMGKSRLVAELVAHVGDAATVLRGTCLPYGEGITYWALHEVVAQAIGLGPDDTGETAVDRIAAEVVDDTVARAVAERVAAAIGLAGAPGTAEETAWAVRRLLESHASARPLVVVIDDLQWAEDALLDLLEHVVDWSADVPLMLVCSARPELLDRRPTWGGGKLNATSLALEPLSDDESARLVANLLGDEVPTGARALITATARGNPLFLEETLRMLVEEGAVRREDGHWTVAAGDIRIPPTIAALLAARLDQLGSEDRGILECAAVCGEEFHLGALVALAGRDASELQTRVTAMARRDLLRPARSTLPGEEAFAFRHILIRDAAYAGLAKARRADLHERFAGWLETVAGARVTEYQEILGHHLERAHVLRAELGSRDDPSRTAERAADLLARAGRRAVERGDLVAADKLLNRADALTPEDSAASVALLLDLTIVRAGLGAQQPARDAADRCVRVARRLGDRRSELLARLEVVVSNAGGDAATDIIDLDEFTALIDEAREWFAERNDDLGLATVWFVAAYLELMLARWGLAEAALASAVEHARRCGDHRNYNRAVSFHVNAMFWGTTPLDACIAEIEELLAEHADEPTRRATLVEFLGSCNARVGRAGQALRLADEADRLIADLGTPPMMARYLGFHRGRILATTGDLEGAVRCFRDSIDRFAAVGDRGHAATVAGFLADTLIDLGRLDEAREAARLCRENTPVLDVVAQWQWRILEATLRAPTDVEGALALADEAVRLVDSTDDLDFQGMVRMRRAAILERAGRLADARTDVEEALRRHQAKGSVVLTTRARERLAGMRDAV